MRISLQSKRAICMSYAYIYKNVIPYNAFLYVCISIRV